MTTTTERLHSTLNGRVMDYGRTRMRPDGTYESFDLAQVSQGAKIKIDTVDPVDNTTDLTSYYLQKKKDDAGMAARDGWELTLPGRRMGRERKVGTGAVTLFGRTRGSGHFRVPGVVLRQGLELGMQDPKAPRIIRSMGMIATMSHIEEKRTLRERIRTFLGRLTMRRDYERD